MKVISRIGSKIPLLLVIGGLILSFGCDMGTYSRRMKEKAKPLQTDSDQVPANAGTSVDKDDDSEE